MRIPNKAHLAAKAFFRDLLDACGGPKRCQALTVHPDSHLSAMGSPHVIDRWPRLDHIIDLEQDCGQPIVTRYLAGILGFDLVPREGRPVGDLPHVFAAAMKEMTDVQVAYVTAVANHHVDAAERAELVKQANQAIASLQDFIVAIRGEPEMMNFDWTPERVEHLKALHSDGKSYTEIALALGCPTRSVVGGKVMRLRDAGEIGGPRAFQKCEASTRSGRDRQCPGLAFVPVIKARLGEGKNDREIADECGIRPDDVRYVRRIKGFTATRRAQGVVPVFAVKLRQLAEQGRSDSEIAKELGISYHQVRYERRRQGIKSTVEHRAPVTTIVKGDPGSKIKAVFAEGFMGQRSRVSLLMLESGMCKFPIDQPDGSIRYCGDHADEGQSYCPHHAARCYTASVVKTPLKPSHVYTARR